MNRFVSTCLAVIFALGAPGAYAQSDGSRPFAQGGALVAPAGKDIRMGDQTGGLLMVAAGGTTLRKQGPALALEKGHLGVGLRGEGRAMRVIAGKLVAESAGGRFTVERDGDRARVRVVDGRVTVGGVGAARAIGARQQLEVKAGKVTVTALAADSSAQLGAWIGTLPPPKPAAKAAPKPAPKKRRGR